MLTRAITGTLFVAVVVGCIVLHHYATIGLFMLIVVLGIREFYKLVEHSNAKPQMLLGIGWGLAWFLNFILFLFPPFVQKGVVGALMVLPVAMFIAELYRKKEQPFANLAYTIFGALYVAIPFAFVFLMAKAGSRGVSGYNWHIPLAFFIFIWSNDTFAYLTGKAMGKTKLFERISPNKTWEGSIGGVVLTMAAAAAISFLFTELPWYHWVMIAGLAAIGGAFGDLAESMFKRSINVKDSGNILPGHGGILDRFDGVFLAAPLVFAYISLIIR